MSTVYRYNQQLAPPAPFVHVRLLRPDGSGAIEDVAAQLDTAADYSMLPMQLFEDLGLVKLRDIPVGGFGGNVSYVPCFVVEVTIRGMSTMLVRAIASAQEPFVLLGRDMLNHFRIVLDGPAQRLEVEAVEGDPNQPQTASKE